LGIPTVADRIAKTVVKRYLEPLVKPCFHEDSYGYRPGKSALDAVGVARQRCWRYAWVLDLVRLTNGQLASCISATEHSSLQ